MLGKKRKKPTKKQLNQRQKRLRIVGAALLCALMGVLFSAVGSGRLRLFQPKTILVGNQRVVVNDRLDRNLLDPEGFSRDEKGRVVYSGGETMTGIDVSVHQGEIDWRAVAGDDIDFAIIRAGARGYANGTIIADERFAENLAGAKSQGLQVGVYFFSQAVNVEEAREEAQFVLSQLGEETLELPVVFDWEPVELEFDEGDTSHAPIRTAGMEGERVTDCAIAFCEEMRAAGLDAMVYLNNDVGYFTYDISRLQGYPIWYAAYQSVWADYYYRTQVWQYSSEGTVAGIDTPVDMDIWFTLEDETE